MLGLRGFYITLSFIHYGLLPSNELVAFEVATRGCSHGDSERKPGLKGKHDCVNVSKLSTQLYYRGLLNLDICRPGQFDSANDHRGIKDDVARIE